MKDLSREIRIGIVILAGFVILIFGLRFLKGIEIFSNGTDYYVVYDNVDGLNSGSPVVYKGLKVGRVKKATLHPTQKGKILVYCVFTEDVFLPVDSKAQIFSLDLLGAKGVNLIEGSSTSFLMANDTIRAAYEESFKDKITEELLPLKVKMERVMGRVDTLLLYTNHLLNPNNASGITVGITGFNSSMTHLSNITSNIDKTLAPGGALNNTLANADSFSSTLSAKGDQLAHAIANLDTISTQLAVADLERTVGQLREVLSKSSALFDSINNGNGTVGMLINDKTLYYNLLASSESLDRLLIDVKQNPKRYINVSAFDFGKEVYLSPKGEATDENDKALFSIKIDESETPLALKSKEINGYVVVEKIWNNQFVYLVGSSKSFSEIEALYPSIKEAFPKSEIVASKNDKPVSLKSAFKNASN